jgi:hypothetical protein
MDDLERRIRAANPHPVRRDEPLSARAERELAGLLATPRVPVRRTASRSRAPLLMSGVAAVLVLVIAAGAAFLLSPRPAMAAPPLLEPIPVMGDSDVVIEGLAMSARSAAGEEPTNVIAAETWSADISLTPDDLATFVQPREVVRTRASDLSGEIAVYAGEVRWGSTGPGSEPPPPGTELERQTFAAGETPLLFTAPPPSDAAALAEYLTAHLGTNERTSTGELFRAVVDLRNEWTLDGGQTAAVLDLIRTLPDVTVAGRVTDRLGRSGIAVSTESRGSGAFRDLLVFDSASGTLLSAEVVYLGGLADLQLAAPTILDYTAWKEPHA